MAGGGHRIGRRALLRGAGAIAVLASPLRTLVAAEPAPLAIRFESAPGTKFRVVKSLISTFEYAPAKSPLIRDRGGMFRVEYVAKVVERTEAGVSTVHLQATRSNGAIREFRSGENVALFDSADPKGQWRPEGDDGDGKTMAQYAKHQLRGRLGPRGEVVAQYAWWRKPPEYISPSEPGVADELHRVFLPVPPAPVRPGDSYTTKIGMDSDPVNSGMFDNDQLFDLGIRFEGLVGGLARFSLRGGIVHDPEGAVYAHAVHRVTKWIDRIDVDGVMDIDPETGWVRLKDQTMRVSYRWCELPQDRADAGTQVLHVVNRRRLIVTATRIE